MRKRTKTDGAKMECARTMRGMGDIAGSREDGKEWDANDGEKDPRIEYGKEEESKEDEKETERREREEQIPDIRSVMMSTISHNPEVPQIAQTVEGVLCKFGKAGGEPDAEKDIGRIWTSAAEGERVTDIHYVASSSAHPPNVQHEEHNLQFQFSLRAVLAPSTTLSPCLRRTMLRASRLACVLAA
ncbi:hypothetical protein BLNAU_973 [Blattamonas nauphoetae]|uniref:Uncharacterized protein n=1 Tax=Blattamonas nauphoetae TaxID=2049346 RepID=A0ABQ9YJG5_9EUKA|nr:hypothetical protein BLNAU_973 [Blattamonas nauphoetae]